MIDYVKFWHTLETIRITLSRQGSVETAVKLIKDAQEQIKDCINEHERSMNEDRPQPDHDVD